MGPPCRPQPLEPPGAGAAPSAPGPVPGKVDTGHWLQGMCEPSIARLVRKTRRGPLQATPPALGPAEDPSLGSPPRGRAPLSLKGTGLRLSFHPPAAQSPPQRALPPRQATEVVVCFLSVTFTLDVVTGLLGSVCCLLSCWCPHFLFKRILTDSQVLLGVAAQPVPRPHQLGGHETVSCPWGPYHSQHASSPSSSCAARRPQATGGSVVSEPYRQAVSSPRADPQPPHHLHTGLAGGSGTSVLAGPQAPGQGGSAILTGTSPLRPLLPCSPSRWGSWEGRYEVIFLIGAQRQRGGGHLSPTLYVVLQVPAWCLDLK